MVAQLIMKPMWNGEKIKALRVHMGLTQTQFAEALGYGRYQTVLEFERGRREIPETTARLLDCLAEKHQFEER